MLTNSYNDSFFTSGLLGRFKNTFNVHLIVHGTIEGLNKRHHLLYTGGMVLVVRECTAWVLN